MAGCSQRTLEDKLGIKTGMTVCVVKAPPGYIESLGVKNTPKGPFPFVQLFTTSRRELTRFFPVMKKRLTTEGMLWISWPKKASGARTDLDENVVREIGLSNGLVDVEVALRSLGIPVAFVRPFSMLLLVPVGHYRLSWFYPALMILLGAHYLPFVFLYGMRMFAFLAAVLIAGGVAIAIFASSSFSSGSWFTGVALIVFAFAGRRGAVHVK
jgi:hypothetical protein